jgi:hypothetical protein
MTDIFLRDSGDLSIDILVRELLESRQQQNFCNSNKQVIIRILVEEMLRSRPICRLYRNGDLFGVYQEIYARLEAQLKDDFSQNLEADRLPTSQLREWAISIRNQSIKKVLDDSQLKKLGLSVQKYPVNSELRRYALKELIEAIRWSNRLCHPHRAKFVPQFYEIIYEEAVVETLAYVCTHIDRYDPERGEKKFMNWVNFRLDKLMLEYRRKFNDFQIQRLPSLKDLDNLIQPEEKLFLSDKIYQFIEEDCNDIYKTTHIKNYAGANFQFIALSRFSGKSWQEISKEVGVPVSTLSSFFQRCCSKFSAHFKKELQS